MEVRDGMNRQVVTVAPGHTLREATRRMVDRGVGAAVVMDPDGAGPGIVTERDVLRALGSGRDPDVELVADNHADDVAYASPDWSLEHAAAEMVARSLRHIVVLEGAEAVGVLSMRDIVRCWTSDGAACELPPVALVG